MKSAKVLDIALLIVAVAMVAYQLISTQYLLVGVYEQRNIHLAFALVLVFLASIRKNRKLWPLTLLLVVLSLAGTIYVGVFLDDIASRTGFPTMSDLVIAGILIIVSLEALRRAYGIVLVALIGVFIAYAFLGRYVPGDFRLYPFSVSHVLTRLALDFGGLYGSILSVSVNYIFLFVVFGYLMQVSGASRFFAEIGKLVSRRIRSGAALSAVVNSMLMGSLTGSGSANVAVTGSFTIPLMKKVGYKPYQAAAIEAGASAAGQVMPPVMGAAAFLMAEFTATPYAKIMVIALFPALLFYFSLALYAHLQAYKMNISPVVEEFDIKAFLVSMPLFIVPLLILMILLVKGYSPMYAIFWTTIAVVALPMFRKETRVSLRRWLEGFATGAMLGAQIAVMCAAIGLLVAVVQMSGLGVKLPGMIETVSAGNIALALVLTMVVSLLLGTGLPPSASYILVAFMVAPVLTQMGVNVLAAHFFVFYFAVWAVLTPPDATVAATAAALAGSRFWETAIEATKVSAAGYLVPYLVIFSPVLILQPESPLSAASHLAVGVLMVVCLQVGVVGYYFVRLIRLERVLVLMCLVTLFMYIFTSNHILLATGVIGFIILTLWQLRKRAFLKLAKVPAIG